MPPPLIPSSKLTALSVRLLHPFYSHDVRLEKIGKSGKTVLCRFFYLFSPDNTRDHELTYAIKLRYKVQLHISISLESTIDGKKKRKRRKEMSHLKKTNLMPGGSAVMYGPARVAPRAESGNLIETSAILFCC